jgi:hypothetical protein
MAFAKKTKVPAVYLYVVSGIALLFALIALYAWHTPSFTIGGSIMGLQTEGLVLQNDGGDSLSVPANAASFTFAYALPDKAFYEVSILSQPADETCSIATGRALGKINGDNITNVAVDCIPNPLSRRVTELGLSARLAVDSTPLAGAVEMGTALSDQAQLKGTSDNATGSVTYTIYTDKKCQKRATTGANGLISQQPDPVQVSKGVVPASEPVTFYQAGTYYMRAAYSGDAYDLPAESACGTAEVIVSPTKTSLKTQALVMIPVPRNRGVTYVSESLTGPIALGTAISEESTLSGMTPDAHGSVNFSVYSDNRCLHVATSGENGQVSEQPAPVEVVDGTVPRSSPVSFRKVGTYYMKAVYTGDTNNTGSESACTQIPVLPNSTSLSIALVSDLTTGTLLPAGSSASTRDTMIAVPSLTGASADAGGTIDYTIYAGANCSTFYASANPPSTPPALPAVVNGSLPDSLAFGIGTSGVFSIRAVYSGDANNDPATSNCFVLNMVQRGAQQP